MERGRKVTGIAILFAMILALATMASAQNVRWSPSGSTTLTQDGWTLTESQDFSSGYIDGLEAVWHINDNIGDSMKMYRDPGIISSVQGMVIARIKLNSGSTYPKGTFGYTSATGNHSIVVAIRNGQVNIKTCEGAANNYNNGDSISVPGGTTSYRVYALRYYSGGTFDLWVSNGSNWSSNSSDWTKLNTSLGTWSSQSALKNQSGVSCTGLVLGSFGSSETWNGYIDYIAYSANSGELTPWSFEPTLVLPDDAQYIGDTIPTIMTPGQNYNVSVTMKNNGLNTWTAAGTYKLGAVGDADPFCAFNRVDLAGGDSISPGQSKTFSFTMTAPAVTGNQTTDWRMIKGATWFGNGMAKQVLLTYPDSAQYISDTIPTTMQGDHQYTVSVTMKNTSSNTWTKAGGYKLGANNDSDPFCNFTRVDLAPGESIGPNQSKTFTFTMIAPSKSETLTTDWRMLREGVNWFGDILTEQVVVQGPPERLVVNDELTGAAAVVGTRIRGGISPSTFGTPGVLGAEGWQCTQRFDAVYYHMDSAVGRGRAEFEIKGLRPNELTGHMADKTELFHMYDYTEGNADNSYGGYRGNKYKMFIRKIGLGSLAAPEPKVDKFEMNYQIVPAGVEPDSKDKPADWDPNTWYKFTVEWWPDGTGNTPIKITLHDSINNTDKVIEPTMLMSMPGFYEPGGHSVRFGASSKDSAGSSAPLGSTYRNIKIWQIAPIRPVVVKPINGLKSKSRTPIIEWVSEKHTKYQVRVCTTNDPTTGIVWDSGEVNSIAPKTPGARPASQQDSGAYQITTGTLNDQASYYVFVKISNAAGWSDWSAGDYWFEVDTAYNNPRNGNVTVSGLSMSDSGGKFLALGATYMRGMQRCKYDRARFRRDCSYLASKGINYIRILTMVSWDQMEIAPVDIIKGTPPDTWVREAWPDYWDQFRECVDIAYDEFGIRTEVTIFADGNMMTDKSARISHMQSVLNNLAGRQHKVMMLEVCNEAWQNGFSGSQGIADLREFCTYLTTRTSIPVGISAPVDSMDPGSINELYGGTTADITTLHTDRDNGTFEGGWRPVRAPWFVAPLYTSLPIAPASSNEPLGPGSSVNTENDSIRLLASPTFAWMSKLPMYVFHSKPGTSSIYDDGNYVHFEDLPGLGSFPHLLNILPSDLPDWTRNDGIEANAPFTAYCNNQANKYWTDIPSATDGCHRNIGAKKGSQFVCLPMGIRAGGVKLEAKQNLLFTVYDMLTGNVVPNTPTSLNAGESFTLSPAYSLSWDNCPTRDFGAYIIRGTVNDPPPGNVTNLNATCSSLKVDLTWTKPTDVDLAGVVVLMKTGGYPTNPTDGTILYNGTGTSCTHTGISSGATYYYAAWAYDTGDIYSASACQKSIVSTTPYCYADDFSYPTGNMNAAYNWSGTAGSEIQLTAAKIVRIVGGASVFDAVRNISCSGSNGIIWVRAKVRKGYGTNTMWSLYIDDPTGKNLARWYSTPRKATGRIGETANITTEMNLTGTTVWDTLDVKIYTATNLSEFFFNGVSIGTLSHATQGAGDSVGRIRFARIDNITASGEYIYLDDITVGDATPPGPVTNFKAAGGDGNVSLSWANPTSPDFTGVKILFKTTGYPTSPTDGTVAYTGTATTYVHTGRSNGTKYYYSAFSYDDFPNYSTKVDASAHAAADATILDAKGLENNQVRALRGNIVSAAKSGYFYIQDPLFYSGIRVVAPDTVVEGQKVDVIGVMAGGIVGELATEKYLDCSGNKVGVIVQGPLALDSVGMSLGSVGGGTSLNQYTPGAIGGVGPNDVGLLVKVWGKVTQRDTGLQYFYINDGSGRKDGTMTAGVDNIGLKVLANPTNYPTDCYVVVTGVVSLFDSSGLRPVVIPQLNGIQKVLP